MKIKVDEINERAIIEMSHKDFFIVKNRGDDKDDMPYGLAHRIDMSYSGKPDQEGAIVIFLSEDEAKKLRSIFDEIL